MRITNQSNLLTVIIARCVDLGFLDCGQRQDDLIRSLKMNGRRIAILSERLQQNLLDGRVCKRTNLIKLGHFVSFRETELALDQLHTLFGEKLRREMVAPLTPVALFGPLVNQR